VEPAGQGSGLGSRWVETWIATFPSLKIGDEEIRNARLRFADLGEIDMLLGADFFLSHRIYVASSKGKLYFTYNGGPVFNLASPTIAASSAAGNSQTQIDAIPAAPSPMPDLSADGGSLANRLRREVEDRPEGSVVTLLSRPRGIAHGKNQRRRDRYGRRRGYQSTRGRPCETVWYWRG
jgi:hypothetical protein